MTNAEKYKTADEREEAFQKFCRNTLQKYFSCFGVCKCAEGWRCNQFKWLELETEEVKE